MVVADHSTDGEVAVVAMVAMSWIGPVAGLSASILPS